MWKKYRRAGQATYDNMAHAHCMLDNMTIWRMRIACWITKATNTHSEYVILIAFPVQQRMHERASTLRYTNIACLVNTHFAC